MKAMVPKDRFNSKGTTEGWRGTTESIADNIRAGSSAADRALQNEDKTRPAPRTLDYELAKFHMQTLKGKVLTIIDAIAFDVEQRKAVKDLVKGAFAEQRQRIQSFCYAGTGLGESIEESDFVFMKTEKPREPVKALGAFFICYWSSTSSPAELSTTRLRCSLGLFVCIEHLVAYLIDGFVSKDPTVPLDELQRVPASNQQGVRAGHQRSQLLIVYFPSAVHLVNDESAVGKNQHSLEVTMQVLQQGNETFILGFVVGLSPEKLSSPVHLF
jgi:flavodoxin